MVRMSRRHCDIAERYYKLAVMHGFTKGRKVAVVSACMLYLLIPSTPPQAACTLFVGWKRRRTCSWILPMCSRSMCTRSGPRICGWSFCSICAVCTTSLSLSLFNDVESIEQIDPALYIQRFAARLEFEDKNYAVINDALRLVSRMDRDWIKHGRRPAGICAAGILLF